LCCSLLLSPAASDHHTTSLSSFFILFPLTRCKTHILLPHHHQRIILSRRVLICFRQCPISPPLSFFFFFFRFASQLALHAPPAFWLETHVSSSFLFAFAAAAFGLYQHISISIICFSTIRHVSSSWQKRWDLAAVFCPSKHTSSQLAVYQRTKKRLGLFVCFVSRLFFFFIFSFICCSVLLFVCWLLLNLTPHES